MELQNIMDDMVCWSMTHIQMCGYYIHCYAAIFLHDGFNCCSGLWCHYSVSLTRLRRVCYRTNAVHELPSPLVHLLWWQTCITILDFHSLMNFDGFYPFTILKRMTKCYSSLVYVASRAGKFTLLLHHRVAFLHRTATCRPLFKPWVSLLPNYKTIKVRFEFLSHF